VAAKAPLPRLLAFGEERGWRRRRLLPAAARTYLREYLGEAADGSPMPVMNVFERDAATLRALLGLRETRHGVPRGASSIEV
jgi:hypothetical protein